MTDPVIRLQSVTKRYGKGEGAATAIDRLDLDVSRGEFVSIMGPSGSGKSTLLNLIAGLDLPDSGRVVFDGRDLSALADYQLADMRLKTIGFIFQSFNLIPALTVQDNVSWPLEFSGYKRLEVRRRMSDALQRVGIAGCEHRFPAELSGGEQQRVAIARAIATGPSTLLADEPTGNLDSLTGQKILDLLRDLNQSEGVTVVMVTHNVFAATYGDRTIEMQDGHLVRDVRSPRASPDVPLLHLQRRG